MRLEKTGELLSHFQKTSSWMIGESVISGKFERCLLGKVAYCRVVEVVTESDDSASSCRWHFIVISRLHIELNYSFFVDM